MKLIKKIAAIMFAFMMVVSMSCNVKAGEGTTATTGETGKITINNAVDGQTYTIYKLLDLESYESKKNEQGEEIGNYSYKPNKDWNSFISTAVDSAGTKYFDVDENGYARWNVDETETAEFAKKALAYAKDEAHPIVGVSNKKEKGNDLTFTNLSLGYYLVDSSVGALCSLDTTNPNATIQEKNGQPTVEKKVSSTAGGGYGESNDVNIGDTVYFQTIITAQAGAQDYVLHDTMDEGFTFTNNIQVKLNDSEVENQYYSIYLKGTENNKTTDGCTFEIRFTKDFCDKLKENDKIYVTYTAMLNSKAFIGIKNDNEGSGNTNTTKITYGVNNKESVESKTQTYTYQIPVFKYTGNDQKPLPGAKFSLYTTETEGNAIKLVQETTTQNYRFAMQNESGITEITTTDTGRFSIQGLKPGNYWLEETAAPKGYNKLKKRIKIAVGAHGAIKIDGNYNADGTVSGGNLKAEVGVENKTGKVLPSTGGVGTTMIYLIGGALVLGSGVVLATKRRVKNK